MSSPSLHPVAHGTSVRGWFAVAAVTLAAFAFVTTEFLPVGLLPQISRDLGLTPGIGGLMVTITGLSAAVSAPATMLLARRIDRRRVLIFLTGLLLLSNLVSGAAVYLAEMLAGRALLGIALGGFWTVALGASGRLVSPEKAALATATMFAGITFATIAGVPLGTFVGGLYSWRVAFFLTAGIAGIVLLALAMLLPTLPAESAVSRTHFTSLLSRLEAKMAILTVSLVITAHFTAYTYIAPFLLGMPGLGSSSITTVLLGFGLIGFISNFAIPRFIARDLRASFMAMAALLMVATFVLPLLSGHTLPVLVDIGLWGLAYGALPVCMSLWMQKATPDFPEAGSAVFVATYQISIAAGSFVGGRVVDLSSIHAALWLAALFALASTTVLAIRRPRRDQTCVMPPSTTSSTPVI